MGSRPFLITIISVLGMLKGIATLGIGILLVLGGSFISFANQYGPYLVPETALGSALSMSGIVITIGIAVSLIGLATFLLYFGLFKMNSLCFWIIFIGELIALIGGVVNLAMGDFTAIFSTLFSALAVSYFWSKRALLS